MTNSLSIDPQYKLNIYITEINPLGWVINWPGDVSEFSKQNGVVIKPGTLPGGNIQNYNEGKTAVHEVGHYFGLYHTFENECSSPGDMVDDTPYHQANYGCPSENTNTCPQTGNDPIHNFMNYTSDPCMNQFTNGQMQRARSIVAYYRPRLVNPSAPAKIDHFYQQPDPLYNGGTGYVYAVIAPGIDNVTYTWFASSNPSNITFSFTPEGNRCRVNYYIPYSTIPTISLTCIASNAYGTDVKSYQLRCALYGYSSFTTLAFDKDGVITDENPIFISSANNSRNIVTDYYLINENIIPKNNQIKFIIHNSEKVKGNSSLDQIELWEVKVRKDENIAVTDEGEIISFKKTTKPFQITLNDNQDVTDILSDKDNKKLSVKKGDKIKIKQPEYSSFNKEEFYSVVYAQLKDEARFEEINNNSSNYNFRPQPSMVSKKIKELTSDGLTIEISEDLVIDYFGFVKNEKTAKVENLKMLEAVNKEKTNVKEMLLGIDNRYSIIYPSDKVSFKFESHKNSEEKAVYILKTVGKLEKDDLSLIKKENLVAHTFELNDNESEILPTKTELLDNYPNPFNPSTTINYKLKESSWVSLKVYDIQGREIAVLVNEEKPAGSYSSVFNASNLASGIYIYKLITKDYSESKKMLLVK